MSYDPKLTYEMRDERYKNMSHDARILEMVRLQQEVDALAKLTEELGESFCRSMYNEKFEDEWNKRRNETAQKAFELFVAQIDYWMDHYEWPLNHGPNVWPMKSVEAAIPFLKEEID